MKTIFGKKQVLLATMILALGVAVYLNYYFSAGTLDITDPAGTVSDTESSEEALGNAQYVSGNVTSQPAGDNNTASGDTTEQDYFSRARSNREQARAEALEALEEMLSSVKLTEEIQREVLTETAAIAQAVERESAIENLVIAKGFQDCVVYIDGDNCNVVVQAQELTAQQTLQITEIVCDQSDIVAQNIKISPVI